MVNFTHEPHERFDTHLAALEKLAANAEITYLRIRPLDSDIILHVPLRWMHKPVEAQRAAGSGKEFVYYYAKDLSDEPRFDKLLNRISTGLGRHYLAEVLKVFKGN